MNASRPVSEADLETLQRETFDYFINEVNPPTRKLIHLDEPHRPRPSWEEWFASTGFHYQGSGDGLRLNDYGLVVQAAIGGQGIALGWSHIVDHPTREGLLVPAFEQQWVTGLKFFVVHHAAVQLSQEAETVKNWIVRGGTPLPKP